ncbi:MAG: Ig-like domain-containing protein [Clostridia bacterium]|nr:Ig-like domain-containing protein [Clostridia bacterium]
MKNNNGKSSGKIISRCAALVIAVALLIGIFPAGGLLTSCTPAGAGTGTVNFPDPEPIIFSGGEYSGSDPSLPPELEKVKITADGVSSGTIPADGSFLVETSGETDVETLAAYLKMTPAVATSVTKLSSTSFKITPASGSLAPGQVYKFTLGDPENPVASYAFQTENNMAVTSMFPADRALNVPVATGIEVTFSDSVVLDGKTAPFSISPSVSGDFSLYPDGKTVLFLPKSNLNYDTVYTVTVNGGVKGRSGKVFEDERTAKFRTVTKEYENSQTSGDNNYIFIGINSAGDKVFSPGQNAYVAFYVYTNDNHTFKTVCDLYAFSSAKQALEVLADCEKRSADGNAQPDVSSLKKVGSFNSSGNTSNNRCSVDFGGGLAKGIYVAVITSSVTYGLGKTISDTKSVIVQVSDLRPYTVSSDGKTVFWLNEAGRGPVEGADLTVRPFDRYDGWNAEAFGDIVKVKTDGSGTASFDCGDCNSAIILAEKGSDAVVVCAQVQPVSTNDYYMNYVFTDREVYFSDDTVNFSGYIAPSFDGTVPERLYLKTGLSSTRTPIEVEKNGFFKGSLSYSQCSAGYFSLNFCDEEGRCVASRSFRITEESKPQYTSQASFDKLFYRRGDNITVTVKASFFDGTPAEGLEFLCRLDRFGLEGKRVVTGKNGEAKITYKSRHLEQNEIFGTDPLYLYFYAELTNFETERLTVSSVVPYFHSDYVVRTGMNDNCSYMTLNRRDTSSVKTSEDLSWNVFPANTVGEPLSAANALSYTLWKYVITRVEHTRYNSYTKQNEKYYSYDTTGYQVESGKKSFVNGIAEFPLTEVKGFNGYYSYQVSFYDDTSKNTFNYSLNGTAGRNYYYDKTSDNDVIITNADSYSVNDTVEAEIRTASGAEKALFVIAANGIAGVEYASKVSFKYTNDMIPGGTLYAAVFDSQNGVYSDVSKRLSYNVDKVTLKPEITASSGSYRPGDTAVVKVKVPGASGGFAVISVVDEACFALGDQSLIPSQFFNSSLTPRNTSADYYWLYYFSGYSKMPPVTLNDRFIPAFTLSIDEFFGSNGIRYGGSKATADENELPESADGKNSSEGGNGWYIRQYFADNPVYNVIDLDSEGCGTLVFTVPDNITSWRITALALSGAGGKNGDLKIGASVSDIVCTQPFFINIGICEQYIVGDTISLSARSYGSEADGKVNYTAVLSDMTGKELEKTTGSADSKDRCWLKFDLSEPGQYRVTVYAESGSNRDAATADFNLVTTAVAADVRKTVTVSELKDIDPVYYPVRLVFTNRTKSHDFYERIISLLSYNVGSGRTDEYAALCAAAAAAQKLYGADTDQTVDELMRLIKENFSNTDGKFCTFPYSEADARLTASLMTLGLPLDADTLGRIVSVSRSAVASKDQVSPEDLAANLVCLASAGEPVLDTLYAVADYAGNFSAEAKLLLALGFAACGDYPAARDIYMLVKKDIGSENSEYGTLKFEGQDSDTTVSLSCLALMTASCAVRDDAGKLALWLSENRIESVSDRIALACYLRYFLPSEAAEPMEFTYTIGDTTENVSIAPGRSFSLSLSKPELEELKLSLPDSAKVGVSYRGRADEALSGGQSSENRIKIQKNISKDKRGNCVVTLNISGRSTRVSEYFELYDLIPSGMRFLSLESSGYSIVKNGNVNVSAYIYNRSGQNMNGGVSIYNSIYSGRRDVYKQECPEYSFEISVSYVIRGAVEGHFIAESAYVKNYRTGLFDISDRIGLDITEKDGLTVQING